MLYFKCYDGAKENLNQPSESRCLVRIGGDYFFKLSPEQLTEAFFKKW
jgi:hypothetical protein